MHGSILSMTSMTRRLWVFPRTWQTLAKSWFKGSTPHPASSLSISKKGHTMADKQESLSIIDKDCSVDGSFDVKGKLVVAGTLRGALTGNTVVTVEGSHVDAPARVREMIIGGEFIGDITVYESLRILSTGAFSGKIACNSITLDSGGKLNGRVSPLDPKERLPRDDTALSAGDMNPASPQVEGDTEGTDSSSTIED